MRAPSRSFKQELDTYRQFISPDRDELAKHWKHRLITKVLDNWRSHPDVERLWEDISRKLPADTPAGVFIGAVLLERAKLEQVTSRLPDVPSTISAAKVDLKRLVANGEYAAVAAEADALDQLISARAAFSRESKQAAEGRFMVFLQTWFEERCGRPFRKHVATLTDVAFGGEHSVDSVRDAMRRHKGRE